MTSDDDLAQMSLSDLRDERVRLQADDDRVSYARRAVQSRLDIVRAEQDRRAHGADADADVTDTVVYTADVHAADVYAADTVRKTTRRNMLAYGIGLLEVENDGNN